MDNQEIDLRAILGVIRRRIRVISVTVLIVLIATTGITFSLKPQYTASTLIMVDPSRKDLLSEDATMGASSSADSARVDSEVEIVRSETTLLRVIEKERLVTDPEYEPKLGLRNQILAFFRLAEPTLPTGEEALNQVLAQLRGSVSVQRRGLTYLVSINAQAASPENAARIANAVAAAHIEEQLNAKIQSVLASRDILQARIADSSAAVSATETAFDDFIDSNIDRITAETGRQDIAALRVELEDATNQRSRLATSVDSATSSLSKMDFAALSQSLQSEALATLEKQRVDLNKRLAGLDGNSPESIDLRSELANLNNQLTTTAQGEISRLQTEVQKAQGQAKDIREQLRTTVLGSDLPADILTNLYELQQTSGLARTQYQTLLSRVYDLETQASVQVADSRIVSPATPPSSASFPNTRLIFALALLAALGLGAGLAFIIENFIGGFTSAEQLEAVTKKDVATSVPLQRLNKLPDGTESLTAADFVVTAPLSEYSESIRRLRMRIDQSFGQPNLSADIEGEQSKKGKVVVVSSSLPVEGKTTTALSLARTYDAAGLSVMLIDCDLRKPSVHRQIRQDPSDGLFELLSGRVDPGLVSKILTEDPLSGVKVIVGARHSDVPTEQLLTNKTFRRLVEASRSAFDVVILDTPPVGVVVDGIYAAQMADVVVFVTRYSSTSQRDVQSALAAIDRSKPSSAPVLLVLTQRQAERRGSRDRYYSYYTSD